MRIAMLVGSTPSSGSGGGAITLATRESCSGASPMWKSAPRGPVTCTEVVIRLRRPPILFPSCSAPPNYFRFRVNPEVTLALGTIVMDREEKMIGQSVEMLASNRPTADEMDVYERLLGDAMTGDRTLFAREHYVEEAWRIVDPVLKQDTPVHEYEPNTWGPSHVTQSLSPPGGWHNPIVTG